MTSPPPPADLLGGYSLHPGRRGAWPRVKLVDEQRRKLVLAAELKRLLEVLFCLRGEAADDIRCNGDTRHPRERGIRRLGEER